MRVLLILTKPVYFSIHNGLKSLRDGKRVVTNLMSPEEADSVNPHLSWRNVPCGHIQGFFIIRSFIS